jgi:hypothetical protein
MPGQSNGMPWSSPPAHKGAGEQIRELKTLVVGYARQETVDPLKSLGRSLGLGIAGSVTMGVGLFLLLLALLRGLQRIEFFNDPLSVNGGTWSWLPYFITALTGTVLMALFLWRLMRFSGRNSDNEGSR